jgi:CoA:oxalate CoA-transferase
MMADSAPGLKPNNPIGTRGPLTGLRVIDLTRILAGPYCTMVLADLGADVVKVEPPGGDPSRGTGPFVPALDGVEPPDPRGYGTYFMSVNRGKRSMVIDLKKPEGRELLLELVDSADVLIENYRPGTMENLGLGYEEIKARNPRAIMVSVSGFGQTGPYRQRAALDIIVQSMGGMLSITGEDGGGPVRPGVSMGDITAALFTSIGVLSAVVERERSGEGQHVDMSMLDCQAAILENPLMRFFAMGDIPERIGTRHPVVSPVQALRTQDGYVAIAVSDGPTGHWGTLCREIGHPELAEDERFRTGWTRTQNYAELAPILETAMATSTTAEWVDALSSKGVPVGPVQDVPQVASDPQLRSRDMFVELSHPGAGPVTFTNTPVKHSRTPGGVHALPPDMGQHTDELLAELGLDGARIQELRDSGAVS